MMMMKNTTRNPSLEKEKLKNKISNFISSLFDYFHKFRHLLYIVFLIAIDSYFTAILAAT
jgi:hypothetical protein